MTVHTGNEGPLERLLNEGGRPVVLLRHGQTAWNQERRFLGRTDVPLDAQGLREAQAVARHLARLPLAAVFSSPLSRAEETARAVAAPHALPVLAVPDLIELHQGELEGQPGSALVQQHPALLARWLVDPGPVRLPGGETLLECQQRGLAAIEAIAQGAQPGRLTVIVSHQMVIASALCAMQALPLRRFREMSHDNAAFSVLDQDRAGWRLHLLAWKGHLGELPPGGAA